jgi:hypothetical protein
MAEATERLTALQARDAAFKEFRDFFGDDDVRNVLLEGIEFSEAENKWVIEIGFDSRRTRTTRDAVNGSLGLFGPDKIVEPIREIRAFYINPDDGSLAKIERR